MTWTEWSLHSSERWMLTQLGAHEEAARAGQPRCSVQVVQIAQLLPKVLLQYGVQRRQTRMQQLPAQQRAIARVQNGAWSRTAGTR